MHEASPAILTLISCHLGPTPMNWYRQFSLDCQRNGVVKSWETFTAALRTRFLPPDHEFLLRKNSSTSNKKIQFMNTCQNFKTSEPNAAKPSRRWKRASTFNQGLRPRWQPTCVSISLPHSMNAVQLPYVTIMWPLVCPTAQQRAGWTPRRATAARKWAISRQTAPARRPFFKKEFELRILHPFKFFCITVNRY